LRQTKCVRTLPTLAGNGSALTNPSTLAVQPGGGERVGDKGGFDFTAMILAISKPGKPLW
ncbi:hypothetical protein, partial [Pseudomonas poae]